MPKGRKDYVNR